MTSRLYVNPLRYSEGGDLMAYETKVILMLLAEQAAKAKTAKEAYNAIRRAANVEGIQLPSYEEFQKKLEEDDK